MNAGEPPLLCTPEPRLQAAESASAELARRFAAGDAAAILHLAAASQDEGMEPSLAWARDWGRQYLARLCQTRHPATAEPPPGEARAAFLAKAPPMRGAEYLSEALLLRLWEDLRAETLRGSAAHKDGLSGWLRAQSPLWHLVGRVTLHLAENKRNETHPFAFLATYTDQLSASGQLQHIPLGRALQTYSAREDQSALDALLAPVRDAAARSKLIQALLEQRRLFQALAWTPPEAYTLIQQIPLLEECGLIVRIPDWWKGRRPSRPQVTVTLDSPSGSKLGIAGMLAFNANITLDGAKLTPEEWEKIRATPAAGLVSLRGRWVEVNRDQLNSVLEHWQHVQSAHSSGGLSFHEGMRLLAGMPDGNSAAYGARGSAAEQSWREVVAGKKLEALLQQLGKPEPVGAIPGLNATLRPYQIRGVEWLHRLAQLGFGACLADDMGLGKTLQVIALLALRRAGKPKPAHPSILVLPASLLGNWRVEMSRFAPGLRVLAGHASALEKPNLQALQEDPARALKGVDVLLTTYQFLQRSEALQEAQWDLAVLDEAQAIKNPATGQARSAKKLRAHARIALTGTPIENRLGDLWSLFDFLNPGLLGNAAAFADAVKLLSAHPEGFAPLRRLVSPYLLRRLKSDKSIISDLPGKTEIAARCPLTKKQAVLYAKIVGQLQADLANPDLHPNERRGLVLGYLVRFKQVCNHPSHWSGDGRFAASESGKFIRLGEIAGELAERQERCLVFTQFREMTAPLAAHLAEVFGRVGLVLHGGTPIGKRQKLVEEFQQPGGPPFFVLTVKSGGTGLTLTEASHVIHFDRWWNPAVENQATDRAYRIGQKRPVMVHKFVCPGTIEEKIDALISDKKMLAEDLLGGEASAHQLLTAMNPAELLDFVRLDLHSALL